MEEPENEIRCPICKNVYEDPITIMKCLHTVCKGCIPLVTGKSQTSCPICGTEFHFTERNILIKGFHQREQVEHYHLEENTSKRCTACEDNNPAEYRCKDCSDFLCIDCYNAHSRKKTCINHTVAKLPIGNKQSYFESPYMCSVSDHEVYPLKMWCNKSECRKPVCELCIQKHHKMSDGHDVLSFEDVLEQEVKTIDESIDILEKKIEIVNDKQRELSLLDREAGVSKQHNLDRCDKFFENCFRLLREHQEKIRGDVTRKHEETSESILRQKVLIKEQGELLKAMKNHLQRNKCIVNKQSFLSAVSNTEHRKNDLLKKDIQQLHVPLVLVSFKPIDPLLTSVVPIVDTNISVEDSFLNIHESDLLIVLRDAEGKVITDSLCAARTEVTLIPTSAVDRTLQYRRLADISSTGDGLQASLRDIPCDTYNVTLRIDGCFVLEQTVELTNQECNGTI